MRRKLSLAVVFLFYPVLLPACWLYGWKITGKRVTWREAAAVLNTAFKQEWEAPMTARFLSRERLEEIRDFMNWIDNPSEATMGARTWDGIESTRDLLSHVSAQTELIESLAGALKLSEDYIGRPGALPHGSTAHLAWSAAATALAAYEDYKKGN